MWVMKFILFTIVAMLISSPGYAEEMKCDFCHVGHAAGGSLIKNDINELCSGCHKERASGSEHKVGMSPPMAVKDIPLYAGKMTCASCHDPHAKSAPMLRKPFTELCASCHDK